MLPLADENPTKNFADVNFSIISLNIIVFIMEILHWGPFATDAGVNSLCMVPQRFLMHFSLAEIGTLFSSMFMHAGWAHIIGNLWFLYIFGDNIEDRLGRFNYLLFYLACGIIGALTTIIVEPTSSQGSLGASGAISGVLGAYLVLFPGVRVKTWVTWYWQPYVPAWVMIGLFYAMNCYSGVWSQDHSVGWFAHVGGFVAGVMLLKLVLGYAEKYGDPDNISQGSLSTFVALCIAFFGLVSVAVVAVPHLLANQKKPAVIEKPSSPDAAIEPKHPPGATSPDLGVPQSGSVHKAHSGKRHHTGHGGSSAHTKTKYAPARQAPIGVTAAPRQ